MVINVVHMIIVLEEQGMYKGDAFKNAPYFLQEPLPHPPLSPLSQDPVVKQGIILSYGVAHTINLSMEASNVHPLLLQ